MRVKNFLMLAVVAASILVVGWKLSNSGGELEPESETEISQKRLPKIRISAIGPDGLNAVLTVMKNHQFDKQYGFEVEIVEVAGKDIPNLGSFLLSGQTDASQIAPLQLARMREEGNGIKIIAPAFKLGCPFIVKEGSEISSWRQLKGKKLGILAPTSGTYQSLKVIMAMAGENMEEYFQLEILPFPALLSSVIQGRVDASQGLCGESSSAQLDSSGEVNVAGFNNDILEEATNGELNRVQLTMIAASDKWLESNPQLAQAVNKAMYETFNYLLANPEELSKDYLKKLHGLETDQQVKLAQKYAEYFYDIGTWDEIRSDMISFMNAAADVQILSRVPQEEEIFFQSKDR